MNKSISKIYLLLIPFLITLEARDYDSNRATPTLYLIGSSFSYSQYTLPTSEAPSSCQIIILQSPGIRTYFCKTPTGTNTGNMCIAVVLNNRFGSRYSNNHHGQLILQVALRHIYASLSTKWNQAITAIATTGITFTFTSTSSGACAKIVGPTSAFSSIMSFIRTMMSDIYSLSMLISDVDSRCSEVKTLSSASISAVNTGTGTSQTFGSLPQLTTYMCTPKWDCAMAFSNNNIGDMFGVPVGSIEAYATNKLSSMQGDSLSQTQVQMCLATFRRERDIHIFIACDAGSLFSSIPLEIKNISDQMTTTYTPIYSKTYYGYTMPPGAILTYSRGADPNQAVGGVIFLGAISPESMLAGAMIIKLTQDHTVTSTSFTGSVSTALIPFAGQSTVRLVSNNGAATPIANNWPAYLSSLQSRYANGANTADFSNTAFLSLIDSVDNHFTVTSGTRTTIPGDSSNISNVLTATLDGYVNWMQIFQSAYKPMSDIKNYRTDTTTNKSSLLTRAASIITNISSSTNTVAVNYTT